MDILLALLKQRSGLVPKKIHEEVHPKTGRPFWRYRTVFVRPEEIFPEKPSKKGIFVEESPWKQLVSTDSQEVFQKRFEEYLQTYPIPNRHLMAVKKITLIDRDYLPKENLPLDYATATHIVAVTDMDTREIEIGLMADGETLAHEIGHTVWALIEKRALQSIVRLKDAYRQAKRTGLGLPTDYAKVNFDEFFAESYAIYLNNPEKLKERNRVVWAAMERLFNDIEEIPDMISPADFWRVSMKSSRIIADPEGVGHFDPFLPALRDEDIDEEGWGLERREALNRLQKSINNNIQKDVGFQHKHDNFPLHPIRVKEHQTYFQAHKHTRLEKPEDEPVGYVPRRLRSGRFKAGAAEKAIVGPVQDVLNKVLPEHFGKTLTTQKLQNIFSSPSKEYVFGITKASFSNGKLAIQSTAKKGENAVAGIQMSFSKDINGNVHANYDRRVFREELKGLDSHVEERLKASGVKSISAVGKGVGRALQGYDFASDPERANMYSKFQRAVSRKFGVGSPLALKLTGSGHGLKMHPQHLRTLKYSWEFANWNPLDAPAEERLGRQIMADIQWKGKKRLEDADLGYKRGVRYWQQISKGDSKSALLNLLKATVTSAVLISTDEYNNKIIEKQVSPRLSQRYRLVPYKVMIKRKHKAPYYAIRWKKASPKKAGQYDNDINIVPIKTYAVDLDAIFSIWQKLVAAQKEDDQGALLLPLIALQGVLYKDDDGVFAIRRNRIVGILTITVDENDEARVAVVSASPHDLLYTDEATENEIEDALKEGIEDYVKEKEYKLVGGDIKKGINNISVGIDISKQYFVKPGLVWKKVPYHTKEGKVFMVYRQIDPKTGEAEGYAPTQSFIEAKFVKPKQGQTHTVGGVYIDPSWTRVLVASNPEARRQVIGVDKTGRLQGKYLASHSADSTANKFDRIKSFTKMLPKIKSQVLRDLGQIEEAQLCYLMLKTGMRVGREPGVEQEKRSFAASTLRNEHVHIEGDVVTMDFIGKAGVKHHLAVKDRTLARMMSIKKDQTQQGQRLFTKNHDNIRDYLRGISGQDFSSKDFRTYVGTSLAIKLMGESAVPTKKREFTAFRNKIVGTVSNQLGNTPTIAFKYYIDPHVWEPWVASLAEQGVTFKARKKADETELEHGGAGYV